MTVAAAADSAATRSTPRRKSPAGYFQRAEMPLTSLLFLLPSLVFYELGTRYLSTGANHAEQQIIAFRLLQQFFRGLGATSHYLPALAVVAILLAWHIARHDPWELHVMTMAGMILESLVLAIPLILMGFAAARYWALAATQMPPANLLVLSIGAGIYEELIFRLIALTLLHILFIDLLGFRKSYGFTLMVVISSVSFASYHYLGAEHFVWRTFAFRTVAGLYFGAIFVFRGFGITAGSHAAYDIMIVLLQRIFIPPV